MNWVRFLAHNTLRWRGVLELQDGDYKEWHVG
jgi:hypothetical protein